MNAKLETQEELFACIRVYSRLTAGEEALMDANERKLSKRFISVNSRLFAVNGKQGTANGRQ